MEDIRDGGFKMKKAKASIDLGNSMIKGAAYINGKLQLKKLPNKAQFEKPMNPKARSIIFNNTVMYIGVGQLNNNVLKHTRKYLLEQVLVMINELFPNEHNLAIDLKLGLPPTQYFNEAYKQTFEDMFPINQALSFIVNDTPKEVTINSLEVFVEGYSAFVSVAEQVVTKQDILSIDVGGGTTDLCNYTFDYDDEIYYPDNTDTIDKGIINFCEEIANDFNQKNNADISPSSIDHILRNNLDIITYKGEAYNLENYILSIKPIIDFMYNRITNKFGQLDRYIIVGAGGGYKIFHRIISGSISKEIIIEEEKQFYANAIGYLLQ